MTELLKWMTIMVISSLYILASSCGRLSILDRRRGSTVPKPSLPKACRMRCVAELSSSRAVRIRAFLSKSNLCICPKHYKSKLRAAGSVLDVILSIVSSKQETCVH
ncbi:hypothetical protein JZ751_017996 [Albula glossodonta]|uniref:Uncharacterized protein n=1 Tax=Albula glossodonta TaxID=121402 RepID=A0A8T2PQ15_9TELE|nr:hypothetical protein JZ751_017996 [Albula glossodonta]